MLDLVYIVRENDNNPDLRYSLRSVEKFVPYNKVWIVGYKPSWVHNVEYIPVKQDAGNKWKNSMKNIITACKSASISDDFVLMNDDFFAIKQVKDLETSCNVALGTLDEKIKKVSKLHSGWCRAFQDAKDLLQQMHIEGPYYDYESHSPIIINKKNFLEFINRPEVQDFMKTSKVLHKRTIYKNMYKITPTILSKDVKIEKDSEVESRSQVCEWVSVYDNQVNNTYYPKLNKLLKGLFPTPCKYETEQSKDIIITKRPVNVNIKKRDFIHRF